MIEFLAILSGVVISLMVTMNAGLSGVYGGTVATIIIHVVGLAISGAITLFKKERLPRQKVPWYMFLGGMIGVFTTYANIYTVQTAGVSLTLALGLVGQCAFSLLIDGFGWFGAVRQQFYPRRVAGLVLIVAGAAAMLLLGGIALPGGGAAGLPVVVAVVVLGALGGATIVLSRMLNADLATRIGVYKSVRMNYITGLALVLLVAVVQRPAFAGIPMPQNAMGVFIYFGGAFGVAVVGISNLVSLRLSALVMTLLVFISQMATGIVIDFVRTGALPFSQLVGGALLLVGLFLYQKPPRRSGA